MQHLHWMWYPYPRGLSAGELLVFYRDPPCVYWCLALFSLLEIPEKVPFISGQADLWDVTSAKWLLQSSQYCLNSTKIWAHLWESFKGPTEAWKSAMFRCALKMSSLGVHRSPQRAAAVCSAVVCCRRAAFEGQVLQSNQFWGSQAKVMLTPQHKRVQ